MIDTVRFRLHDLKKHNEIYRALDNEKRQVNVYNDQSRSFLKKELAFYKKDYSNEFIHNYNSGTLKRKVSYIGKFLPSSNYKINCKVILENDMQNSFIEWEFSFPKYFYGTNILQTVINPLEKEFNFIHGSFDTFNYQLNFQHERLIKYFKIFFYTEFPRCQFDFNDIEILRIDLCFNQIFNTKEDSLEYLNLQSNIQKKYARDTTRPAKYQGGLTFVTSDYSAKIYHKGLEYAKNDFKEHEKLKKQGKGFSDLQYLQDLADRTLRYEITFRKAKLSYLYNHHVFRSNNKQFTELKKLYNKLKTLVNNDQLLIENWEDKIKPIVDKFHLIKGSEQSLIEFVIHLMNGKLKAPNKQNVFEALKKFYDQFDSLLNSRRTFFMSLDNEKLKDYSEDNYFFKSRFFQTEKIVPFSKEVFYQAGLMLRNFMEDLKIENRNTTDVYLEKIDLLNEKIKRENEIEKKRVEDHNKRVKMFPMLGEQLKVYKGKPCIEKNRLGAFLICLENSELHELKDKLSIPDRTYYRYKAELKLIGFTKNTQSLNKIFNAPLDYYNYYLEVSHPANQKKLFINNTAFKISDTNLVKPNYNFDLERIA
jgi:hypothetical protein